MKNYIGDRDPEKWKECMVLHSQRFVSDDLVTPALNGEETIKSNQETFLRSAYLNYNGLGCSM